MVQIEMNGLNALYCILNSYLTYVLCIIVVKSLGHKVPVVAVDFLSPGIFDLFLNFCDGQPRNVQTHFKCTYGWIFYHIVLVYKGILAT